MRQKWHTITCSFDEEVRLEKTSAPRFWRYTTRFFPFSLEICTHLRRPPLLGRVAFPTVVLVNGIYRA